MPERALCFVLYCKKCKAYSGFSNSGRKTFRILHAHTNNQKRYLKNKGVIKCS